MSDARDDGDRAKFPLRIGGSGKPVSDDRVPDAAPPVDESEAVAQPNEAAPPGEPPFIEEATIQPAPEPGASVQIAAPANWPAPAPVAAAPFVPLPVEERPMPELAPIEPARVRRKRRPLAGRIALWAVKLVLVFVLGSVLWVSLYRFVAPPVTLTMIGDAIGGHGITRQWMPLSSIDPSMARAAIAAEDARFCLHNGFDFKAIEAAAERNAKGNKRIRGGSTISQQTAKNVFLWQGGGYFRKGLEAWFTVLIETIWGKRRIMEVYLNVAETGIGTYGVNAGAQRYFGHDASHMSTREAAQIAAVLPLPKKRPGNDPTGYTARYGSRIAARVGVVRNDGLDGCLR